MKPAHSLLLFALTSCLSFPMELQAAWKCPAWVKALQPRRTTEPARYGDIHPHAQRMTPDQIGRLIIDFAEESFDHEIYFEDKPEKDFFVKSVQAFMALSKDRAQGRVVPVETDPFAADQICSLLKRVKINREKPEDVTIRDYLHYFYKDELFLQGGLESLPKRGWSRPYRYLGWGLRYLLIGAGFAMGWETYQAVTGSLTSSVKEMTSAEGRLQSYRSLMSGLLSYDPRQGAMDLETRRNLAKQVYVGANSTMADPEILGRDLILMIDEAVTEQSTNLKLSEQAGNTAEIWIGLERVYFLETFFPDIWNNPLGFGTHQRIQALFKTHDPTGEIRRVLEANKFPETFSVRFNIQNQNDWWSESDPLRR